MVAPGRFSEHAEDVTWLWPGHVQPDHGRLPAGRARREGRRTQRGQTPWWEQDAPRTRNGGGHAHGAGYGIFFVQSPRDQRVLTKPLVAKSHGSASAWYKHGAYLQRDGAQQDGPGRGFDAHGTPVNLSTTLARWHRAGDPLFFKVMLSPEHGDRLDLREFLQAVMRAVQWDLGLLLEWAAVDHDNTGHPHVHLCIRGVSNGQIVRMARSYLHEGMRERAQEVATRMLGVRLAPELEHAAARAVTRRGWSALDQSIVGKLSAERTVADGQLTPREQERLTALAARGLAWRINEEWQLSPRWEEITMERAQRDKTQPEHEHDEDKPNRQQDHHRDAQRAQDEQQRRIVQIDDLEQDMGWER